MLCSKNYSAISSTSNSRPTAEARANDNDDDDDGPSLCHSERATRFNDNTNYHINRHSVHLATLAKPTDRSLRRVLPTQAFVVNFNSWPVGDSSQAFTIHRVYIDSATETEASVSATYTTNQQSNNHCRRVQVTTASSPGDASISREHDSSEQVSRSQAIRITRLSLIMRSKSPPISSPGDASINRTRQQRVGIAPPRQNHAVRQSALQDCR